MLIDDPSILRPDPILDFLAALDGNGPSSRLQQGVYQINHFGSSDFPGKAYFTEWNDDYESRMLSISNYGVCDNVEQILEKCPELQDEKRQFIVTLTEVRKDEQPARGGWRWHKWGEYIGTHEIQCEYLHDEQGIERVLVYHIHERKPQP